MRKRKERPSKGETTFKLRKSKKNQEKVSNQDQLEISDEEVENFMKKHKKGTCKFKGKLPRNCFNCGKVGHFSNKCPYPKEEESYDEETYKEHKKRKIGNKKKAQKTRRPSTPKKKTTHLKKVKKTNHNIYLWV